MSALSVLQDIKIKEFTGECFSDELYLTINELGQIRG